MLLAERRRKQEVAGKIGHDEYQYKLRGDPSNIQNEAVVRPQGHLEHRRVSAAQHNPRGPPWAVDEPQQLQNNRIAHGDGADAMRLAGYTPAPAAQQQGASPTPFGGDGLSGGAAAPRFAQSPYHPVLPALAHPAELPPPLPSVFKVKPPVSFHSNGLRYSPPSEGGNFVFGRSPPPVQLVNLSPTKPVDRAQSPAEPAVAPHLPPLQHQAVGARENRRPSRPSLFYNEGDPEEEQRQAKQEARRRALELQRENERQIEERRRRKEAEKQQEWEEQQEIDRRAQREREALARREQAELLREEEDRDIKMHGPRAAAILAKRAAAAAAAAEEEAKANKKKPTPAPAAPEAPTDIPKGEAAKTSFPPSATTAATSPPSTQNDIFPPPSVAFAQPQPGPASTPPMPFRPSSIHLQPPPSYPYQLPLPAATNAHFKVHVPSEEKAAAEPTSATAIPPTFSYEADKMKSELQRLSEDQRRLEQVLRQQAQRQGMPTAATGEPTKTAAGEATGGGTTSDVKQPLFRGAATGAGTYLTATEAQAPAVNLLFSSAAAKPTSAPSWSKSNSEFLQGLLRPAVPATSAARDATDTTPAESKPVPAGQGLAAAAATQPFTGTVDLALSSRSVGGAGAADGKAAPAAVPLSKAGASLAGLGGQSGASNQRAALSAFNKDKDDPELSCEPSKFIGAPVAKS